MPIKIAEERVKHYVKKKVYTSQQAHFILQIATLVYKASPTLDDTPSTLSIFPTGIELVNEYGVRAFYLKETTMAHYYQYQHTQINVEYREFPKLLTLFTEKEITTHIKRKRFPRTKNSATG